MPHFAKIALIALAAFAIPIGVVLATNWEGVKRYVDVAPQDVKGHVLYFTTFG